MAFPTGCCCSPRVTRCLSKQLLPGTWRRLLTSPPPRGCSTLARLPEVREALGPGFPKHPLHKIVCIGALVASRQPEGWRVDALGAPHISERSEAELISAFAERV